MANVIGNTTIISTVCMNYIQDSVSQINLFTNRLWTVKYFFFCLITKKLSTGCPIVLAWSVHLCYYSGSGNNYMVHPVSTGCQKPAIVRSSVLSEEGGTPVRNLISHKYIRSHRPRLAGCDTTSSTFPLLPLSYPTDAAPFANMHIKGRGREREIMVKIRSICVSFM